MQQNKPRRWGNPNLYFGITENACFTCTPETGRHPGCHGTCEKYKEYRRQRDEHLEKERKEAFRNAVIGPHARPERTKF